jgi:NAD(P)-dependent dehydrogenase (short-subunit alcohol dehydrogenase family)
MTAFPGYRLDGRVAIVTGASSGIGAAIAEAMAQAGAKLVLVGRDAERLARTAAACGDAETSIIAVDVTADDAPERIVQGALGAFGRIDSIVHSAGVFYPKPFPESPVASLDEQWRVNVRAPYAITHAAQAHLEPGSSVIFISSIAGKIGFPQSAAYCATKGAIEMLVKSLSTEFAPRGVRVNAIAPGNIHSPMNEEYFKSPEYERAMIENTPAGRVGVVEDIAPAVVFLASDAARYVHGVSILVDGGWAA